MNKKHIGMKRILAGFFGLILIIGMIPAMSATVSAATFGTASELTVNGTPPAGLYTSVPVGAAWNDSAGNSIQAHGGGFVQQGGWYYWVGENKSSNSHNTTGINLYRSKDLLNWEFVSTILSNTTNPGYTTATTPGLISPQTQQFNMERPKLIYDQASGKFVLFAHWENGTSYGNSHILIASAGSVDGHYTVLHNFRPGVGYVGDPNEKDESYTGTDGKWGYGSRDFTVYQDPGTGEAYLISTQDWQNMRVYKLTENSTNVDWQNSYLLFSGGRREAPAMIKANGVYYIITSSQSGWYPNQAMYSFTTDISNPSGWSALQPVGNNTTFYSQPTNIMEIVAADGSRQNVYMGDRWNPEALGTSAYVWLPLNIDSTTHTMTMSYTPGWSLDPVTGAFHFPDVSNVSQGKPVEGEDNVVSGKLLKYINDGSYDEADTWSAGTLYYQQNKVPYAVTIDLQEIFDLSRVDISFKQFNGSEAYYDYTVQGSNDNKNWTILADETQNKMTGFKSNTLGGKYRYVRLYVTSVINAHNGNSTASWENGMLEVQVYANNLTRPIATLPAASEEGGRYTSDQTITLSSKAVGAKIYYTTDGTEPTNHSTLYTTPVTLTLGHTILKAVAYAEGMEPSGVMTKDFDIIDPNVIVSVSSPTEYAVTTGDGASGLPATLQAVNAAGNTVTVPVIWNTAGVAFSPYTSVKITGTLPGYQVSATVDVVNAGLTYFISGGSQGNSAFYNAAKAKLGGQLVNTVSDQAYNGQWGYTGKIGTDIGYHTSTSSIYDSGWWAYSNKSINYSVHLDPGTYTLVSGYKEWWGATRGMTFSAKDASGSVLASKSFTINKATLADQEKIEFTLAKAQNVQISVSKVSGSDPVLAWLAVEKKTPVTTAAFSPALPDGEQGWYISPVSMTLTAAEAGGTVTGAVYSVDNGTAWSTYTGPVTFNEDGQYSVAYYSTDAAGGAEYPKTQTFKLDHTAPVTTASLGSASPAESGWYTSEVTVSLAASDNVSGVSKTEYQINNGDWTPYTGSIPAFGEGIYTVGYRSTDQAGNVEPIKTLELKIDKTAPALTVQLDTTTLWPANHKMVTIHAALNPGDATSGVESVILTSITINEPDSGQGDIQASVGTAATSFSLRAEKGKDKAVGRIYTITYTITDKAGNKETSSVTVRVPHDQSVNNNNQNAE
ncbi:OmpL47-type beta-barrel domain-containing protein [Paenibacillus sp. 22594]|uniref:OmpL47-type beta-barrel domain-containing protein n=1 Tax=Paenibacillus sp. 22594 TaxID=3453947 RepID=UPI003F854C5D